MSSFKTRWTLSSSRVLTNNIKLSSLVTSSTLLSADSKTATLLLKPSHLANSQPSLRPTLEKKLKILLIGEVERESIPKLTTIQRRFNTLKLTNQPLLRLTPERRLKILLTGVAERESIPKPTTLQRRFNMLELMPRIRRRELPPMPIQRS